MPRLSKLIEAVRGVGETGVPALPDYPAALRFALRADQLASGKNLPGSRRCRRAGVGRHAAHQAWRTAISLAAMATGWG